MRQIVTYMSVGLGFIIIGFFALSQVSITYSASKQPAVMLPELLNHLCNPHVQAFLDAVAGAEGTLTPLGYRTMFSFQYFTTFTDHPRLTFCKWYNGMKLCSNAAGRYQMLEKTWDWLAPQINARNFCPFNQDLAAVLILEKKGAIPFIRTGKFEQALDKVKTIWSSLPGAPYGQPTRSVGDLKKIFAERLLYHKKRQPLLHKKYNLENYNKENGKTDQGTL